MRQKTAEIFVVVGLDEKGLPLVRRCRGQWGEPALQDHDKVLVLLWEPWYRRLWNRIVEVFR